MVSSVVRGRTRDVHCFSGVRVVFTAGVLICFFFSRPLRKTDTFAFWWLFAHLILPPVSAEVTIRDVLQLGAVNRTPVRVQLATELRIVIRAGLVESSHIAVAATALAVGLGVVGVEIVAARESTMAARYPANMGLLL